MGAMINEDRFGVVDLAVTPAAVGANTTSEQTFTVPGLMTTDFVEVNKPSFQAGLTIAHARASAFNTIAITFVNNTAASITPTAETYMVHWFRAERQTLHIPA